MFRRTVRNLALKALVVHLAERWDQWENPRGYTYKFGECEVTIAKDWKDRELWKSGFVYRTIVNEETIKGRWGRRIRKQIWQNQQDDDYRKLINQLKVLRGDQLLDHEGDRPDPEPTLRIAA